MANYTFIGGGMNTAIGHEAFISNPNIQTRIVIMEKYIPYYFKKNKNISHSSGYSMIGNGNILSNYTTIVGSSSCSFGSYSVVAGDKNTATGLYSLISINDSHSSII